MGCAFKFFSHKVFWNTGLHFVTPFSSILFSDTTGGTCSPCGVKALKGFSDFPAGVYTVGSFFYSHKSVFVPLQIF